VRVPDILRAALADAASRMVLIHNHPSGDPDPSVEDIVLTRLVAGAAAVVGMPLTDHVIVTSTGDYVSLLDLGMVEAA
jgi:DNA repair protein RadC